MWIFIHVHVNKHIHSSPLIRLTPSPLTHPHSLEMRLLPVVPPLS